MILTDKAKLKFFHFVYKNYNYDLNEIIKKEDDILINNKSFYLLPRTIQNSLIIDFLDSLDCLFIEVNILEDSEDEVSYQCNLLDDSLTVIYRGLDYRNRQGAIDDVIKEANSIINSKF